MKADAAEKVRTYDIDSFNLADTVHEAENYSVHEWENVSGHDSE